MSRAEWKYVKNAQFSQENFTVLRMSHQEEVYSDRCPADDVRSKNVSDSLGHYNVGFSSMFLINHWRSGSNAMFSFKELNNT